MWQLEAREKGTKASKVKLERVNEPVVAKRYIRESLPDVLVSKNSFRILIWVAGGLGWRTQIFPKIYGLKGSSSILKIYELVMPAIFSTSMYWSVQLFFQPLWVEEPSFDLKKIWIGEPTCILKIYGLEASVLLQNSVGWRALLHFENLWTGEPVLVWKSMGWRAQFCILKIYGLDGSVWFQNSCRVPLYFENLRTEGFSYILEIYGLKSPFSIYKSMDWRKQLLFEKPCTGGPKFPLEIYGLKNPIHIFTIYGLKGPALFWKYMRWWH